MTRPPAAKEGTVDAATIARMIAYHGRELATARGDEKRRHHAARLAHWRGRAEAPRRGEGSR